MKVGDLPRIFKFDIRIKTTKGYYYRHYIDCGKEDCIKCTIYFTGHPYWYFYPNKNPLDEVFYLSKPELRKIHIWGKIVNIRPKDLKHIKNIIIHNK